MSDKLNTKKVALSLAIVSAILYLACALLIAIIPGFTISLFSNLFHGVDISRIASTNLSLGSTLIGLVEVIIYSLVVGWLFVRIYNKLK